MDGLLINSEDIVGESINEVLKKYNRPPLTTTMRSKLMGVPNSSNSDLFHDWAQLPITREQWARESGAQMMCNFAKSQPLPGAKQILYSLSHATCASTGEPVELALASSSPTHYYKMKMTQPETKKLLEVIREDRKVLGDDPRVKRGREKPEPDIYLAALESLNSTLPPRKEAILPNECLAFEDSVAGVESARRAGMRVVWVPHPILVDAYHGKEKSVLAGRSRMFDTDNEWQLGELEDEWVECIQSLEDFQYGKYGLKLSLGE
jgi:pseudouridine-5'-monophosphatase